MVTTEELIQLDPQFKNNKNIFYKNYIILKHLSFYTTQKNGVKLVRKSEI